MTGAYEAINMDAHRVAVAEGEVLFAADLAPVKTVAATVSVTSEILADADGWTAIEDRVAEAFDRRRRPWAYPDKPALPALDLFPTLTAAAARVVEWRTRVAAAWDVLRNGPVPTEDGWDL